MVSALRQRRRPLPRWQLLEGRFPSVLSTSDLVATTLRKFRHKVPRVCQGSPAPPTMGPISMCILSTPLSYILEHSSSSLSNAAWLQGSVTVLQALGTLPLNTQ